VYNDTNIKKCKYYRTINLISHTSKILTKIVYKRIENEIEENLIENTFGFIWNGRTGEAIFFLRLAII
jgi:hypothetical protein